MLETHQQRPGEKSRAAITFVESTDEFGIDHESTSMDVIYQSCKHEGQSRYNQANTTPLMNAPLLEDFGTLGHQATIDKILQGSYECPDGTPEYTRKFIHELHQPAALDNPGSITGYMTTENFTKSWKRMRVNTAPAPSDHPSQKSSPALLIPRFPTQMLLFFLLPR
jgi:hypothetical protein